MNKIVNISEVKVNPNNPRLIKDDKFKRLVQSVKDFPEMLEIRPIVVNKDMIILGGNMRFKACQEAKIKTIPIIITDLTEQQQKEFLIKDNISGGEWDWDILANEWNAEELKDWGLDVWQPNYDFNEDDFFEKDDAEKENQSTIVLNYTENDFAKVVEAFEKHTGSREQIVFKLLGL